MLIFIYRLETPAKESYFNNTKAWKQAYAEFQSHFPVRDASSDEEEGTSRCRNTEKVHVDLHKDGWPIIPHPAVNYSSRELVPFFRAFVNASYSEAFQTLQLLQILTLYLGHYLNTERSLHCPWRKVADDPLHYIADDCLPDPAEFPYDPAKASKEALVKLLRHWLQQQDKGLQPLLFIAAEHAIERSQSKKSKAKMCAPKPWVSDSSDEEGTVLTSSKEIIHNFMCTGEDTDVEHDEVHTVQQDQAALTKGDSVCTTILSLTF